MSTKPYDGHGTRVTPQDRAIPGSKQVPNSAGGFAFALDNWGRLDRFLILGTEGGTYYVGEQKLTADNAKNLLRCIREDGPRVVRRAVEISQSSRAPKNDPAIFALAACIGTGDTKTKRMAAESLSDVCRIGTHLFHFAQFVEQFRGWGRVLKRAVANWYTNQDSQDLAYQLIKYRQRDGWSHKDLLILSHPSGPTVGHRALYDYVVHGVYEEALRFKTVMGYELLNCPEELTPTAVANTIREYELPREAVPTQFLKERVVWETLLEKMPLTAMIRNLGNMSKVGLLVPLSDASKLVCDTLTDGDRLAKSRVHPIQVLAALLTYQSGRGARGSGEWTPVSAVVDALDRAFYLSFGNVESTGQRVMLALDVSGSMGVEIQSVPGLSARAGSAAMALVTAAVEPNHVFTAFSSDKSGVAYAGWWSGSYAFSGRESHDDVDAGMTRVTVSPRQRLDDVVNQLDRMPFGGTDCALPMLYALKHGLKVDAFVVYTDSETWAGGIHPVQALKQYREKTGIPAKLVVVGMTATEFTIADPDDAGMLDVVGFDTSTPQLIADFISGPRPRDPLEELLV